VPPFYQFKRLPPGQSMNFSRPTQLNQHAGEPPADDVPGFQPL